MVMTKLDTVLLSKAVYSDQDFVNEALVASNMAMYIATICKFLATAESDTNIEVSSELPIDPKFQAKTRIRAKWSK